MNMFWYLLEEAAADAAQTTPTFWQRYGMTIIMVGVLAVLIVAFWVMSSRSKKKQRKEAEEMMEKFTKGAHVKTIGGIMGKVVYINDKEGTFVLETGSNKDKCHIKFDKQALYQVTAAGEASANRAETDAAEEASEEAETENTAE